LPPVQSKETSTMKPGRKRGGGVGKSPAPLPPRVPAERKRLSVCDSSTGREAAVSEAFSCLSVCSFMFPLKNTEPPLTTVFCIS
jgi:hypothetical protein